MRKRKKRTGEEEVKQGGDKKGCEIIGLKRKNRENLRNTVRWHGNKTKSHLLKDGYEQEYFFYTISQCIPGN